MNGLLLSFLMAVPAAAKTGTCHQLYVVAASRERARSIQAKLGASIAACPADKAETVNFLTWTDNTKEVALMVEAAMAKGYLTIAIDGTLPTGSKVEKAISAARKMGLNAFLTKENQTS